MDINKIKNKQCEKTKVIGVCIPKKYIDFLIKNNIDKKKLFEKTCEELMIQEGEIK